MNKKETYKKLLDEMTEIIRQMEILCNSRRSQSKRKINQEKMRYLREQLNIKAIQINLMFIPTN